MAAKANVTLLGQIDVRDAYIKVDGCTTSKRGTTALVQIFKDKKSSDAFMTPLQSFNFSFQYMPQRDPIEIAYLMLCEGLVSNAPKSIGPVLEEGQKSGELPDELRPKADESRAEEFPAETGNT